jgi:hypothetical protein
MAKVIRGIKDDGTNKDSHKNKANKVLSRKIGMKSNSVSDTGNTYRIIGTIGMQGDKM